MQEIVSASEKIIQSNYLDDGPRLPSDVISRALNGPRGSDASRYHFITSTSLPLLVTIGKVF